METPEKALDAIIDPDPLTLGQIALLERIKSPIITRESFEIDAVAPSLWLLSLPFDEARKRWSEARDQGIQYVNTMSIKEFYAKLESALIAYAKVLEMLPAPEDGSKKKETETDSSPS